MLDVYGFALIIGKKKGLVYPSKKYNYDKYFLLPLRGKGTNPNTFYITHL